MTHPVSLKDGGEWQGEAWIEVTANATDPQTGNPEKRRLAPHPLRAAILGELHARPLTPLSMPARVLHFAFHTPGERAAVDRAALVELCRRRNLPGPKPSDKHHRIAFDATILRWEQHSEFTTYTWEFTVEATDKAFRPGAASLASVMTLVPQPGPLLAAIDLHLLTEAGEHTSPECLLQRTSLAVAENSDGTALYATDFQTDPAGFVRILVVDRGLDAERAGALVQRVIELEPIARSLCLACRRRSSSRRRSTASSGDLRK